MGHCCHGTTGSRTEQDAVHDAKTSDISYAVTAIAAYTPYCDPERNQLSPDDKGSDENDSSAILISGGEDCKIVVWSLPALERLLSLRGHQGPVSSLTIAACKDPFSPTIGSASADSLRLWQCSFDEGCSFKPFRVLELPSYAEQVVSRADMNCSRLLCSTLLCSFAPPPFSDI